MRHYIVSTPNTNLCNFLGILIILIWIPFFALTIHRFSDSRVSVNEIHFLINEILHYMFLQTASNQLVRLTYSETTMVTLPYAFQHMIRLIMIIIIITGCKIFSSLFNFVHRYGFWALWSLAIPVESLTSSLSLQQIVQEFDIIRWELCVNLPPKISLILLYNRPTISINSHLIRYLIKMLHKF